RGPWGPRRASSCPAGRGRARRSSRRTRRRRTPARPTETESAGRLAALRPRPERRYRSAPPQAPERRGRRPERPPERVGQVAVAGEPTGDGDARERVALVEAVHRGPQAQL